MVRTFLRCLALGLLALPAACHDGRPSGDALIAVATNFREAAAVIEEGFEAQTGYEISTASGATGQLYAQIHNGAPFDVMLSADQRRPQMLLEEGYAVKGTRFTYAIGKLILWSADDALLSGRDGGDVLKGGAFRSLAIANPDLAPYGAAAVEALESLGLLDALGERIVRGQTVGQAFSMVASGNAELGLVAQSQVTLPGGAAGSFWVVPPDTYSPIRQDAVLLERAASNEAARAFLDYLKSDAARLIIEQFGYEAG